MPRKIYQVRLTKQERESLLKVINRGKSFSARVLTRTRILLLADELKTKVSMPVETYFDRIKECVRGRAIQWTERAEHRTGLLRGNLFSYLAEHPKQGNGGGV